MRLPLDFRSVFAALERGGVRYVTVGGLATVLHGVDRLTADIDLGDTECRIVSLRHLVEIKRAAGRKKDVEDADRQEELLRNE